ncbi:helicase domain-containing protein, partial [Haloferax sp. BAB-2207]
ETRLRKYRKVGLLDQTVPTRKPERRRIELNDETRQVYDRIDEYTRTFYKKAQQSSETETAGDWVRDDDVSPTLDQQRVRDFSEPLITAGKVA